MERIEVTKSEQQSVDEARDALHRAVIEVCKAHDVSMDTLDLTEVGESIALEGDIYLPETNERFAARMASSET